MGISILLIHKGVMQMMVEKSNPAVLQGPNKRMQGIGMEKRCINVFVHHNNNPRTAMKLT